MAAVDGGGKVASIPNCRCRCRCGVSDDDDGDGCKMIRETDVVGRQYDRPEVIVVLRNASMDGELESAACGNERVLNDMFAVVVAQVEDSNESDERRARAVTTNERASERVNREYG